MAVGELDTLSRAARPPRAVAWVLLLASAATVLAIGVVATAVIFGRLGPWPVPPTGFWWRLFAASALTIASVSLRSLRWIFLLRRADTRIPIRDAYIGYLAGLSLLFAPLLLGEIAVRAYVNRVRGRVPIQTTVVVNVWERILDGVAIVGIAVLCGLSRGGIDRGQWLAAGLVMVSLIPALRRTALRGVVSGAAAVVRVVEHPVAFTHVRLADSATWAVALATSVVAWVLPGIGLWLLAGSWDVPLRLIDAEAVYAHSAAAGMLRLAPGGVLVAGPDMLTSIGAFGLAAAAALVVFGIRLATVGVSVALGSVFVLLHVRTAQAAHAHFDEIADAYDVQIPESRRHALLELKTGLMAEILRGHGAGRRGLDVGCGQGTYVARMRAHGFDVRGIDASAGQVRLAARNVGEGSLVQVGSVLDVPAPADTYDFLYVINVLHHLASLDEQRAAFREMFRVLKPGGVLFVHEINTRNILFRFYMGYVFPSLNCIDEGVERWLVPNRLGIFTDVPVAEVRYFTFLPDFIPQAVARVLRPFERGLERSAFRVYSAHYMAVLIKPVGAS